MVQNFPNNLGKDTRWKNNVPGKDWLTGFRGRHKTSLTFHRAEKLSSVRAQGLCIEVIGLFSLIYGEILTENAITAHPERLYNCDETGFATDPTGR